MGVQPSENTVPRGGVGDQSEALVATVEDQIVDDAAFGIEQGAVDAPAGRGLGRVVGKHAAEERRRLFARQVDDGHVRNVECARRAPHRVVFGHLRAVAERHRPAGEGRHLRASGAMLLVERRTTQRFFGHYANAPKPIASRTNCALTASDASIQRSASLRARRRHGPCAPVPQ